jgi:hypothetical protein
MDYEFLLYSFLFAVAAFAYYKLNKWSLKGRNANEEPDLYSRPHTNLQIFNSWIIIIGFAITSLVYFFKSIG